jgi:hypothetical protein
VFDEAQLRRMLKNYAAYYNQLRTHLSLAKRCARFSANPEARSHRSGTNPRRAIIINTSGFRF